MVNKDEYIRGCLRRCAIQIDVYFTEFNKKQQEAPLNSNQPWLNLTTATSKISLDFASKDVAEIVQYWLCNSAICALYSYYILAKNLSFDWEYCIVVV